MNDVVIGNWRAGIALPMGKDLETVEKRYNAGFRQLPYESTVMELVLILDAYDNILGELLGDGACACIEHENTIVSETHTTSEEGVSLTIVEKAPQKARSKR